LFDRQDYLLQKRIFQILFPSINLKKNIFTVFCVKIGKKYLQMKSLYTKKAHSQMGFLGINKLGNTIA